MVRFANWIDGKEAPTKAWLPKIDPANGVTQSEFARSGATEVDAAVQAAKRAQPAWAATPAVARGDTLHRIANLMESRIQEVAAMVAAETGKSLKDAQGEAEGAVKLARFFAGEGQRLFGRTTTSGTPNRSAMIFRQPIGVAGLIASANTPIANVAWKVFPALICGNGLVFKASEDAPGTASLAAKMGHEAGLPPGLWNVVQGTGPDAGQPLAEHPSVGVLSFTGSTKVGRLLGEICARRLAKCSLELGGKNAFVVLNDADLEKAVHWAALSAFSNAGQRCASASRIIVEDGIYDRFRDALVEKAKGMKVGPANTDDFGPVINSRQLAGMAQAVAETQGTVLCGGKPLDRPGFYFPATVIEDAAPNAPISCEELFGPIACLYRVGDYHEALALARQSEYGLTACIHTKNLDRAWHFVQSLEVGVASINGATFGSEPHMPFGGTGWSGNGTREPGPEALDIYSRLKNVLLQMEPDDL